MCHTHNVSFSWLVNLRMGACDRGKNTFFRLLYTIYDNGLKVIWQQTKIMLQKCFFIKEMKTQTLSFLCFQKYRRLVALNSQKY